MKRIVAFLFAVALFCLLTVPAFGATEGGVKITSYNDSYKVFSVTASTKESKNYTLYCVRGSYTEVPGLANPADVIFMSFAGNVSTDTYEFKNVIPKEAVSFTAVVVTDGEDPVIVGRYIDDGVLPEITTPGEIDPEDPDDPGETDSEDPATSMEPGESKDPSQGEVPEFHFIKLDKNMLTTIVLGIVSVIIVIIIAVWVKRNFF